MIKERSYDTPSFQIDKDTDFASLLEYEACCVFSLPHPLAIIIICKPYGRRDPWKTPRWRNSGPLYSSLPSDAHSRSITGHRRRLSSKV